MRLFSLFKKGALGAFLLSAIFWSSCFAATPSPATPAKPITPHHSTKKPIAHHHPSHHYKHTTPKATPVSSFDVSKLIGYQDSVCSDAKAEIGKEYVWGGTSPSGFDCSGFSQYVYKQEGIEIPRTALQQYDTLTPVKYPEPGDLVFFRTHGHHVSHVGIYLGNGYFIHSPKTGENIRVDKLSAAYWKERYAGARRALTWNYVDEHFNEKNFPGATTPPELDPIG